MTDSLPKTNANADLISVRLSREELEDATRLLSSLSEALLGASLERTMTAANDTPTDKPSLQRRALRILADRKRRYAMFGKGMFGEPAWEMLLLLYALAPGPRQTITKLGEVVGASKSTALRWIDYLETQRLIRRESHPTDRRAAFIELTEAGVAAIELYLSDTADRI